MMMGGCSQVLTGRCWKRIKGLVRWILYFWNLDDKTLRN